MLGWRMSNDLDGGETRVDPKTKIGYTLSARWWSLLDASDRLRKPENSKGSKHSEGDREIEKIMDDTADVKAEYKAALKELNNVKDRLIHQKKLTREREELTENRKKLVIDMAKLFCKSFVVPPGAYEDAMKTLEQMKVTFDAEEELI
jgi:uncharacterized protein YutE (UPF0331/DUF86 family)